MKPATSNSPEKGRLNSLRDLNARIRAAELHNDDEFRTIFRDGQNLLEMSDQELGDALSVSRPTVNRWVNGKNLPHPALRKPIADWMIKQLSQKMKYAENAVRQSSAAVVAPRKSRRNLPDSGELATAH